MAINTEIIEKKHTRTGEMLYVVTMLEKVDKDTYFQLSNKAKKHGGWYSSYTKEGAIAGFHFKSKQNAQDFIDENSDVSGKPFEPKQKTEITSKSILSQDQITIIEKLYQEYKKNIEGRNIIELPENQEFVFQKMTDWSDGSYGVIKESSVFQSKEVIHNDNNRTQLNDGDIITQEFSLRKADKDGVWVITKYLLRDRGFRDKITYYKKAILVSKSGKENDHYTFYEKDKYSGYLIDNKITAVPSKNSEGYYVPSNKEYFYFAKMYANGKQVEAAVKELKSLGYTDIKSIADYGRFAVAFNPHSDNIKEITTYFDENKYEKLDLQQILSEKQIDTSLKLNLPELYKNKKSPRKDLILKEILDGKMEYAVHKQFNGITDSSDYFRVDNDSFKDIAKSDTIVDRIQRSIGQSHWIYSARVDYSENIGYYVNIDDYYIRYKNNDKAKQSHVSEQKESNIPIMNDEYLFSLWIEYAKNNINERAYPNYLKFGQEKGLSQEIIDKLYEFNAKYSDVHLGKYKSNSLHELNEITKKDKEELEESRPQRIAFLEKFGLIKKEPIIESKQETESKEKARARAKAKILILKLRQKKNN